MSKEVFIHVGLHKTGTTAIQHFLQNNRERLRHLGLDFYQGEVFAENHVELHAVSMRVDRQSGYKNRSGITVDETYINGVKQRVSSFIKHSTSPRLVFSNEGLSLLRYPDELLMLQSIIRERIKIIVYVRNSSDYLASYAKEIRKNSKTVPDSISTDSFAYTEPDSWLIDYAARIGAFQQTFGHSNVLVKDYDKEMLCTGNVIPSFLDVIGVKSHFEPEDWFGYQLNKSPL